MEAQKGACKIISINEFTNEYALPKLQVIGLMVFLRI